MLVKGVVNPLYGEIGEYWVNNPKIYTLRAILEGWGRVIHPVVTESEA